MPPRLELARVAVSNWSAVNVFGSTQGVPPPGGASSGGGGGGEGSGEGGGEGSGEGGGEGSGECGGEGGGLGGGGSDIGGGNVGALPQTQQFFSGYLYLAPRVHSLPLTAAPPAHHPFVRYASQPKP